MKKLNLVVCGDICPTKDIFNHFNDGTPEVLLADIIPLLNASDILVGNLEFSLSSKFTPAVKTGPILHAHPHCIDFFKKLNFDALSLANNHIKDCGAESVLETIEICKNSDINTFGAGNNQYEAKKPYIVDKNGIKVCIVSFSEHEFNAAYENEPGAALFDPYFDLDRIQTLKESVDVLIVLYHGGIEHYQYPSPELQKKCRRMVDKGADFVVCQHSHIIGTEEQYHNGRILYGQGNSIYGYREGDKNWNQGLIVSLQISKVGNDLAIKFDYIPIEATKDSLKLLSSVSATDLLDDFMKDSSLIQDSAFIQSKWLEFCDNQKSLYFPQLYGFSRVLNKFNRVVHNKLINILFNDTKKMITHNLIRCESHNEVIQTILSKRDKQ